MAKDLVEKQWRGKKNLDGTINTGYQSGNKPTSAPWKLAAGNFVPAKMPFAPERVVYPRPDSETPAQARHRNALIGVKYRIPVSVQGGAWPFRYQITFGPEGATIGETVWSENHGVIEWTPTTAGSYVFTVKVTDQDYSELNITWTVSVNNSWVVEVDPVNGNDANSGAFGSPVQTFTRGKQLALNGKHLLLRAGTHYHEGDTEYPLANSATTALGLVGYPGENAVIDAGGHTYNGRARFSVRHDSGAWNVSFTNINPAVNNPCWLQTLDTWNRITQFECRFLDGRAAVGNDNVSCLFLGAGAGVRNYVLQNRCYFTNLAGYSNGFSTIDIYKTKYVCIEKCTWGPPVSGTNPSYNLWVKAGLNTEISIRGNTWTHGWNSCIDLSMGSSSGISGNIEVCYNLIRSTDVAASGSSSGGAFKLGWGGGAGQRLPVWSYRNTYYGKTRIRAFDETTIYELHSENDVIVHDVTINSGTPLPHKWFLSNSNDPSNTYRDFSTVPQYILSFTGYECQGNTSAGIVDSDMKLAGAYRIQWLGKRGHEIPLPV